MKRTLVLFTLEYPDPLLEKEVKWLSDEFDSIYVLPGKVKSRTSLYKNVEVVDIFNDASAVLDKPWRKILKHFAFALRMYWWALTQSGYRWHYIRFVKSFLGYLLIEAEKISPLEKFIRSNSLEGALFYDYWLVDTTLALAELKRRKLIRYTIARAHGFDLYHERQFEKKVSYQAYRIKYLNAVFAVSQHGYNYLKQNIPEYLHDKIKLSYLGVSVPPLSEAPVKSKSFVIVSCSNLIPLKRVGLLIDSLMQVKLPIKWIHFGDGPLREGLEARAQTLPANISTEFRGQVRNEDVLNFYQTQQVDLFVSLSESEGLPVSMMEAGSMGIPILACAVNGVPEIVVPRVGILLDRDCNATEVATQITRALEHHTFDRADVRASCVFKFNAQKNFTAFARTVKQIAGVSQFDPQRAYQQCTRCVLDTTDSPTIEFDESGVCSYCRRYEQDEAKFVKRGLQGEQELSRLLSLIKQSGRGKPYDSLLGISGGVDSTYLALQAKKWGLNPLLVHFDNGWNSELAVANIEQTISRLGFDLHTLVIEWEEFRDLQLAFLKASVVDIEMVTDHAIIATLYRLAIKFNIKYILSGTNIVTEGVLPANWIHFKGDHVHIKALQKQFVGRPLRTYPLYSVSIRNLSLLKRIRSVSLLNLIDYNKDRAKAELKQELGWRDYGGKHYESVFTRFYQGYILPTKFKIDKRKAHLSTLICSGQMTREEALHELQKPLYEAALLRTDYDFVVKKMGLTPSQFEEIMNAPVRLHTDYPVEREIYERMPMFKLVRPLWRWIKKNFFSNAA